MPTVTVHQILDIHDPEAPTTTIALSPGLTERLRDIGARVAPLQLLKRTGERRYAFNGQILATVCGIERILPFWYEINVYRSVIGTYVSDIRLFGKGEDIVDVFRVAEHNDIDELRDHLGRYDPHYDLPPIRCGGSPQSSAALMLRAIEIRADMQRISEHYRVTVSALLDVLD